jgi:hypothetical protein
MKEKYIEERIPRWLIFGIHPNGNVDVSDGEGDVLQNISRELADEVVAARNRFVDERVAYWMERPEEFFQAIKPR